MIPVSVPALVAAALTFVALLVLEWRTHRRSVRSLAERDEARHVVDGLGEHIRLAESHVEAARGREVELRAALERARLAVPEETRKVLARLLSDIANAADGTVVLSLDACRRSDIVVSLEELLDQRCEPRQGEHDE